MSEPKYKPNPTNELSLLENKRVLDNSSTTVKKYCEKVAAAADGGDDNIVVVLTGEIDEKVDHVHARVNIMWSGCELSARQVYIHLNDMSDRLSKLETPKSGMEMLKDLVMANKIMTGLLMAFLAVATTIINSGLFPK